MPLSHFYITNDIIIFFKQLYNIYVIISLAAVKKILSFLLYCPFDAKRYAVNRGSETRKGYGIIMKKLFERLFFIFLFGSIFLWALYFITNNSVCFAAAVTFLTIFYHISMRLLVGYIMPHSFTYTQFWFTEKSFEKPLYKKLRVKKWKGRMPSYNPNSYSVENNTLSDIAKTMCRNEVTHEINALLSFVPLIFILPFGAAFVFIITSVVAAAVDMMFAVMQRYNRPRIVKLIERQKRKTQND